jgi:DNA-binding HxlR family transcriptional regulator
MNNMAGHHPTDEVTLTGRLADRDSWDPSTWCSVERTLDLIGTRSALILLREIFYGGHRFDDLARRAGVTDAIASKRLRELVDAGVLDRRPYQEPGQRPRQEYVLTEAGRALFPVLIALVRWGDAHTGGEPPIRFTHRDCGGALDVKVLCEHGHEIEAGDTIGTATGDTRDPRPPAKGRARRRPPQQE